MCAGNGKQTHHLRCPYIFRSGNYKKYYMKGVGRQCLLGPGYSPRMKLSLINRDLNHDA